MAPKFPNPDPPTDKVRDRLDQFIEVAGRAVYPPLAVAPSPSTPGQVWWDVSSTVKIRDEANAAWADLLTVLGGQPAGSYQPAGGYVRYDAAQALTATQSLRAWNNMSASEVRGNNGYAIMPSGLIIQWGRVSVFDAAGAATITFPMAFPTAQVSFMATAQSDWGASDQLRSVYSSWTTSLTIREIYMRSQSGTAGVVPYQNSVANWIAIGY